MFTVREGQVVKLLAKGKSDRAIARELRMGEGTVRRIAELLEAKTGFTSRAELAVWCWGHCALGNKKAR